MLVLVAIAMTVQLPVGADAALPCPAHAALAEALQRRAAAQGPSEAELAWTGGSWQLTLRRSGAVLLQRSWELPASDCALLADTAALVIDRYFSGLRQPSWTPRPRRIAAIAAVAPPPAEPAAPPPAPFDLSEAEPVRPVLIPSMPAVMGRADSQQLGPGMVVSVGLALTDDLRPGLWLQAERRWASGTASFLLLAGNADHEGRAAETSLQSALMALSVGPCFDMWVRACFAPFAGVRGRLSPEGRTLARTTELRLVPELGATVSIERQLPFRFNAALSLLAGRTLGEADFDPAAPPQEIDYAMALRVGYQF